MENEGASVWILILLVLCTRAVLFPISYLMEPNGVPFVVFCGSTMFLGSFTVHGRRIFFDRWCQVIVQSVRVNLFSFVVFKM